MTNDELQAIRERDAAMPEGYVFVPELVDRRTLLREYDKLAAAARKAVALSDFADISDANKHGTLTTSLVRGLLADLRKILEGTT